jgi:uncharacterized protein YjbJ (UPF0337 family)
MALPKRYLKVAERARHPHRTFLIAPQRNVRLRTKWKEVDAMNWDQIEGKWKQFRGKAQQQWGKLTDDDLDVIDGHREQLAGKLQERYGYAKEEAEKEVEKFAGSCSTC